MPLGGESHQLEISDASTATAQPGALVVLVSACTSNDQVRRALWMLHGIAGRRMHEIHGEDAGRSTATEATDHA